MSVPVDPCNLIVNYIPTPVGDNELSALLAPCGEIVLARVIHDKVTGAHRGFGFVKFANEAGAATAMRNMNGAEVLGKRLKLSYARGPQDPPFPAPAHRAPTQTPVSPLSVAALAPPCAAPPNAVFPPAYPPPPSAYTGGHLHWGYAPSSVAPGYAPAWPTPVYAAVGAPPPSYPSATSASCGTYPTPMPGYQLISTAGGTGYPYAPQVPTPAPAPPRYSAAAAPNPPPPSPYPPSGAP